MKNNLLNKEKTQKGIKKFKPVLKKYGFEQLPWDFISGFNFTSKKHPKVSIEAYETKEDGTYMICKSPQDAGNFNTPEQLSLFLKDYTEYKSKSIDVMWKTEDPRLAINKRANIVIFRPGPDGPIVGTAFVDTKNGWYIHTSFDDYKSIDVWNTDWKWTFIPKDI